MPILYVHGVATRDSIGFEAMKPYLRRLVAPAISGDPHGVHIDEAFWGGSAAAFAWNGASRPRTRLLGQGAAGPSLKGAPPILAALLERELFTQLPEPAAAARVSSALTSGHAAAITTNTPARLSSLTDDELSDVLAAVIFATSPTQGEAARLALMADALAHDREVRLALAQAATPDEEAALIIERIRADAKGSDSLVGMGSGFLAGMRDRLSEALSRGAGLPAYATSLFAAETRPTINEMATLFLGDVFVYISERGDAAAPGEVVQPLLKALAAAHANKVTRNGEPLVVITHSMGGQLVYDAVTHFLPQAADRKHIRVDFWCAAASQVGLFEELKLFRLKDTSIKAPDKMPFPHANLGVWWNVWDPNDFLSFTAGPIFNGVDDEPYDSGLSLVGAHSGSLQRPSFFRRLATKLERASQSGWRTI